MPKALDPAVRTAIEQAIRDGGTRNAIAREHCVSGSTVSKIAQELGPITRPSAFDRSATKKATEAVVADAAALRTSISTRAFSTAQRILESFEDVDWVKVQPYSRAVIFGILVERGVDLAKTEDNTTRAVSLLEQLMEHVDAQ